MHKKRFRLIKSSIESRIEFFDSTSLNSWGWMILGSIWTVYNGDRLLINLTPFLVLDIHVWLKYHWQQIYQEKAGLYYQTKSWATFLITNPPISLTGYLHLVLCHWQICGYWGLFESPGTTCDPVSRWTLGAYWLWSIEQVAGEERFSNPWEIFVCFEVQSRKLSWRFPKRDHFKKEMNHLPTINFHKMC